MLPYSRDPKFDTLYRIYILYDLNFNPDNLVTINKFKKNYDEPNYLTFFAYFYVHNKIGVICIKFGFSEMK